MAIRRRPPQNAVIFHHPDAVDTSRSRYLDGFARRSGVAAFYCQSFGQEDFEDFKVRVGKQDDAGRPCHRVPLGGMGQRNDAPKTLMHLGPNLGPLAWRRRLGDVHGYSLCGMTPTIASGQVMDKLAELLIAPLQQWDALVCTSDTAKAAVVRIMDNWADYLGQRTGAKIKPVLQLPVIPPGVDCDAYAPGDQAESERKTIRQGLGIGDEDIAVLTMGRLSLHGKAHPTPMYLALEETARRCGRRLHLIQAGWFANDSIEKAFRDGVHAYCPSVNGIFLDGREPSVRSKVWWAADIFTSLSDSIRENSGLTPIEAMAAGLPVVVSDWDGYRDTVRHETDGFRIPTWLPLAGSGTDLSLPPEASLHPQISDKAEETHLGLASQFTVVDVGAAANAFTALAGNPELRIRMGAAAQKRARESFDWRVIIGAYQRLWQDLENIRNREDEIAPVADGCPAIPLRDDPFSVFQEYAGETIDGVVVVSLSALASDEAGWAGWLEKINAGKMNTFSAPKMLGEAEINDMLGNLEEEGYLNVYALAEKLPENRRYLVARTVAWLAKMGIVNLEKPPASTKDRYE